MAIIASQTTSVTETAGSNRIYSCPDFLCHSLSLTPHSQSWLWYPSNCSQHIPSTLLNWQQHFPQTSPLPFPFLAPTPPSATWLRHPALSNTLRCLPVPRPLTHFRASLKPPASRFCRMSRPPAFPSPGPSSSSSLPAFPQTLLLRIPDTPQAPARSRVWWRSLL